MEAMKRKEVEGDMFMTAIIENIHKERLYELKHVGLI